MRKKLIWIFIGLILLGTAFSGWDILNKLLAEKEKPVVILPEKKYEKGRSLEFVRNDGVHFLALSGDPFLLEFRFNKNGKNYFSFYNDGVIFKIKEIESIGIEVKEIRLDKEKSDFTWVRLRREQPNGWARFLVEPRVYRGKFDIKNLTVSNEYEDSLKDYLKEEENIEVNSIEVKKAAAEIRQSIKPSQRNNPYWLVKATLQWLDDNIVYSLAPKYLVDAFAEVVKKMPAKKRDDIYSLFFEFRKLIPKVFPERYKDIEISDEVLEKWTKIYSRRYSEGRNLPIKNPYKLSLKFLNRLAGLSSILISGVSWKEISAKSTLKNRWAKCVGVSYAFVAICRRLGIPAKEAGEYLMVDSYTGRWHSWAVVYFAGYGWIEVDPTLGEFDNFSYERHLYEFFWLLKEDNVEVSAYKLKY